MNDSAFTPEKLMMYLTARYESLNDNNAKAQEVYNTIISKTQK